MEKTVITLSTDCHRSHFNAPLSSPPVSSARQAKSGWRTRVWVSKQADKMCVHEFLCIDKTPVGEWIGSMDF